MAEFFPFIPCWIPRQKKKTGHFAFEFMDDWYPIQVKQKDKAGRPDIDAFEAVMMRDDRPKGFFVSFDYSDERQREVQRFFKQSGKAIVLSSPFKRYLMNTLP